MPDAEQIASRLAYDFLKAGRYAAATGPVEIPRLGAAAANGDIDRYADDVGAFSGLSVQSVGFEEGADTPKVHIYLTRGSTRDIKSLPPSIDDVQVRVHKMGAITIRPDAAGLATNRGNIFERNDRICCGSSCGPTSERSAGTLGALVQLANSSDIFLLSNNHVFSGCNHVPYNQPILSPSSMDGRPDARAPQEIGRHHQLHPLVSGDPHFVNPCDADLALARASAPDIITSWQGNDVSGFDTPSHTAEPVSLKRVKKFGRTTGLTHGEVEAKVTTPMPVSYTSKHFKGVVWFKEIWSIRGLGGDPFALGGDSGSLVVSEDGRQALGLVFAANPSGEYAWMIPMPCVTSALGGLRLVSGHGT